jgi:hypothetical protein
MIMVISLILDLFITIGFVWMSNSNSRQLSLDTLRKVLKLLLS